MKRFLVPACLALVMTSAAPAYAQLLCRNGDYNYGLDFDYGFRIGPEMREGERDRLDLTRLRQAGVDAARTERWGGCIRAYVNQPDGTEEMQFFEPSNLRRVR